jgi:muramoyltetrapeptide carboxypeptidase
MEDVNKSPVQIDRLLTHLRNANKLEKLKGVVFADMNGCDRGPGMLWDVVADLFKDDTFPVFYGVPSGHGKLCLTLPLGAPTCLDARRSELRFDHGSSPVSA